MTSTTFKLKAPTVEAIEITSLAAQAADVANLIQAAAYQVDVAKAEVTFMLESDQVLVVKTGQVAFMSDGAAVVRDAAEFYGSYEKA